MSTGQGQTSTGSQSQGSASQGQSQGSASQNQGTGVNNNVNDPQAGDDDDDDGGQQQQSPSLEELQSENRRLKAEARRLRQDRNQTRDQAQQGTATVETLTRERDELRSERDTLLTQLRDERASNAITKVATTLHFRNPSLASTLIRLDEGDFGDDGKPDPKGIELKLKQVLKSDPYLATVTDGGAGGGDGGQGQTRRSPGTNDMSTLIRQATGRV